MNKRIIVTIVSVLSIIAILCILVIYIEMKQPTPEERIKNIILSDIEGTGWELADVWYIIHNASAPDDIFHNSGAEWDNITFYFDSSTHIFVNFSFIWHFSPDYEITYFEAIGNITVYFKTLQPQKLSEGYDLQREDHLQVHLWAYYEFFDLKTPFNIEKELKLSEQI